MGFGWSKKSGRGMSGAPGPLTRPHSEADFSELDENALAIDNFTEDEVNAAFEKMLVRYRREEKIVSILGVGIGFLIIIASLTVRSLIAFPFQDDMNLSEEKKEPLRLQPFIRKKEMLSMHMKGTVQVRCCSPFSISHSDIPRVSNIHLSSYVQPYDTLNFSEMINALSV